MNKVERFYQASHERNVGDRDIPVLPLDEASAELSRPSHRYHCAYKFLERNGNGKDVVELGFGSPRLLGALSNRCSSYTIVDIVDRIGKVDAPTNVRFRKADLSDDFPFPNKSFDCTIAMMIIELYSIHFTRFARWRGSPKQVEKCSSTCLTSARFGAGFNCLLAGCPSPARGIGLKGASGMAIIYIISRLRTLLGLGLCVA